MLNNLREVGIRVKLRPLERAAFFKAYAEKKLKNIVQGASGAFGNCATRAEAFVVKGGAYVYGSYPDIDALFAEQAVRDGPRQARGDPAPPAAARARTRRSMRRSGSSPSSPASARGSGNRASG